MTHFIEDYGLVFLFAIVTLESAGLWLPGETALIAAAVYASKGHLSITGVITVAAVGAIVGDNIGYWLGREGGRRLLYRYAILRRFADRLLPAGERFFARHGGKAVFLARFFGGVRVTGAWMGILAFFAGKAAADALARYGVYAAIALALVVVLLIAGLHLWRRRVAEGRA